MKARIIIMGEYGSGVSFARSCAYDKERIKMALQGKLLLGESENGFEYADAPREECEAFILSAYDNAVYQATEAFASGRAIEKIMKNHNFVMPFTEYIAAMEFERKRDYENSEYKYESDLEMEDADEEV